MFPNLTNILSMCVCACVFESDVRTLRCQLSECRPQLLMSLQIFRHNK